MKHLIRTLLLVSVLILTIFIAGCGIASKEDSKEAQIKKSFEKTLSMYPIKNLEDLYDIEGYRDEEFDKDDKGTWLLYSRMSIQLKGKDLESKGMVIKLNRNTRSANGAYVINTFSSDRKDGSQDTEKKYPVKLENNKIISMGKIEDSKIRKEIEKFQFFAQYADFKDLKNYKNGDISYNPNVPSYSVEYNLENNYYNVKQLRERYDIPKNKAPKLLLKGAGDLKGTSLGYKDVKYIFIQNQKENIHFSDSIKFMPSED